MLSVQGQKPTPQTAERQKAKDIMTNKITLTIHADEFDSKSVQNAVRRALSGDVTIPESGKVEAKGVTITVREVKGKPVASKQDIRTWAAKNGFPEVAGKRGRIAANVLAAYAEAN